MINTTVSKEQEEFLYRQKYLWSKEKQLFQWSKHWRETPTFTTQNFLKMWKIHEGNEELICSAVESYTYIILKKPWIALILYFGELQQIQVIWNNLDQSKMVSMLQNRNNL